MEQRVAASEIQTLPSFEAKLAETRRKKVVRFLAKQIKAGLRVIAVGEHGERQFEFADLFERLSEEDRVALIQMRTARTVPAAAPATTPTVAATVSAEELAALEESWEGAADKSRARAERNLRYVVEVEEITRGNAACNERKLRRACRDVAERYPVGWYSIFRSCIKVKGRPSQLWAFLLLDKNHGRSRHEYGRDWDRYFRSYYLVRTAPAASVCRDFACKSITKMDVDAARRAGIRVPTAKALHDRLRSELSEEAILLARCGADAVAARHYQERDYSSLCAGEGLSGDGHKFNFWVKWSDGYVGRPVIFAFQCLYTNAVTGWRVDRTENQDVVRLAAADAFRKGLPRTIFIDNGRAGASKWLTGGVGPGRRFRFQVRVEDAIGVFRLLGIDIRFTEPYAGRSKKIERFWGDFESRLRARPEFRFAYAGNGKDEPAENAADHAIPLELFIRVVGEEIAAYNARGHDTPILKGASCNEVWDRSVASPGAVLRKATESQLRLLLLAAQKVRVHVKDSCIHMFGNRYEVTEDPAAVENGRRIISGTDVVVRFDPERLHDDLCLYDREGHFLGTAKCVSPTGFADHAAARETARLNKVRKRHLRGELEAQDLIDRIALGGTLPQIESPAPAAAKVVRPLRSPIEAPRASEREVFDSSMDIYDDDEKVA
jgi:putative transposase